MTLINDNAQPSFSVMTVNVRFGLADSGKNSWDNRKPAFAALFKNCRPDFVAMQEVNHFQADFFQRILSEYNCIGQRDPAPKFWQDVLIFYNKEWDCLDSYRFFLTDTPDIPSRLPDSQWPRQCVMGRFSRNQREVVCVSTHFDFADQVQQKSAKIVLDQLSRFSSPSELQILTGDFNSAPGTSCYNMFTEPECALPPFSDAFDEGAAGTFHNFTGEPVGDRIDWILWRGRTRPLDWKMIADKFAGRYPSDHFPVYAVFDSNYTPSSNEA